MLRAVGCFTAMVCLIGCTGSYEVRLPETGASLEGTVTLGEEKVQFAQVTVMGEKSSATANVQEGRYKIENVPLGAVRIAVNTEAARGDFISQTMAHSYKGPGSKGGGTGARPRFVNVPNKYWEPETSGVTTTVKKGANTFDIALTK
jgi:hypothetical protein